MIYNNKDNLKLKIIDLLVKKGILEIKYYKLFYKKYSKPNYDFRNKIIPLQEI